MHTVQPPGVWDDLAPHAVAPPCLLLVCQKRLQVQQPMASGSHALRCVLQHGKLGHQVSVLLGHTGPVTFLDFCEAVPDALLSSSIDGTCRIWGATHPSSAMHILEPNALFGLARGVLCLPCLIRPYRPKSD